MSKDYYKILGVTEFDSAENIKIAYRKLARKCHPDIAGSSADALNRFKDINEAYEILSNKIKKEEYDRVRQFYNYANSNSTKSYNKETSETFSYKTHSNPQKKEKNFAFNWEEFISKKNQKESFKKEQELTPQKGCDINTDIEISVFEALSGTSKCINMLQTQSCPICNGRKFANGSICNNCHGKGEINSYKKFTIKIPAEIKDKSKIRLAGEGGKGINGGSNGDLYITVHIKEPKTYKTEGLNILKTIPITPFEAVLGTSLKVSTINGNVNLKIHPETQNGQKIRLSGCGLVQNNKIGDMIITIEIRIPKNLTQEEILLYKKLEDISTSNIRDEQYE